MFGLPTNPLAVLTLLAAVVAFTLLGAYWLTLREIGRHRRQLIHASQTAPGIITEDQLAPLPQPVQRYLRYSGVAGRSIPRLVTLNQKGRIRSGPEAGWMSLQADEIYSTNPPAFVWRAWLPTRRMGLVIGRDVYIDGKCSIAVRLLGLLVLASENGAELGKAGLVRYLNEMMWFPAALLGANVRLIGIDDGSFTAVLTDHGETARGQFFIDEAGRLTNFRAQRYNTATRSIETWETPVSGYADFGGYRLPTIGSACWRLAGGTFTYIELEVANIAYSGDQGA